MNRAPALLAFAWLALCVSCESTSDQPFGRSTDNIQSTDTNPGTTSTDPGETDTGYGSGSEPNATSTVCDAADFEIDVVPVRLMILLDRSGSMTEGEPTKWDQARSALQEMLGANNDGGIEFGFDAFPDDGNCGVVGKLIADSTPGSIATIEKALIAMDKPSSGSQTPLCKAMNRFTNPSYAPQFLSPNAQRYLLIVSDGEDNCAGSPTALCGGLFSTPNFAKLTSTLLDDHGIRTFVIGFGDGATSQLNNIAKEGGTPFDQYIPAANQDELQDALETIAGTVVSCTFEIGEPSASADPNQVNVFFDNTNVGYDEDCALNKGWKWTDSEHTRVELCEAACEQLRSGDVKKVRAEFGCPSVPVY